MPPPLTQADIIARLGLEPWDEHAARVAIRNKDGRRSGRTTRMLVAALELLSRGERVTIYAGNVDFVRGYLGELGAKLGIDTSGAQVKRTPTVDTYAQDMRGRPRSDSPAVFLDNYQNRNHPWGPPWFPRSIPTPTASIHVGGFP